MNTSKKKLTVSVVALLAVVGGILGFSTRSNSKSAGAEATPEPQPQPVSSETGVPSTGAANYKDGTYSAVGSYGSPGGPDDLNVTLTLKNGIVTDSTVTSGAHDPRSERYQQIFIGGYKQYVIGKPIDSINLDVVSGSSLTPQGFNDALGQIKAQAKA